MHKVARQRAVGMAGTAYNYSGDQATRTQVPLPSPD
jgi:hypothetical protein